MSEFCQDINILAVEPVAFLGGFFPPGIQPAGGNAGNISGILFTDINAAFVSAGVKAGMVLVTTQTIAEEGSAWEVISVDSETQLTISALRSKGLLTPLPPGDDSDLTWFVRSFIPQIAMVSAELSERFRRHSEAVGVEAEDFAESSELIASTASGVLAKVFRSAATAGKGDVNWLKAEHYSSEFEKLTGRLRLAVDVNGDGTAEQTRCLGNVRLRRD